VKYYFKEGEIMKLLFATGNEFKFNLMKERLKEFEDIELVNPKMLGLNINVVEDGITAEENATKKSIAYYEATHLPTIAEDSGLFIDKFKDDEQPGLFVKRVNGQEGLSDDEILKYYIDKLKKYNGRSLAHYYTGVCIIDEEGNIHSDTIEETEFMLLSKPSMRVNLKGGVLESISYDLEAEKYFNDRSEEEKQAHYKELDEKYRSLIDEVLRKKKKR
jgi:non-canonical purine NTP pyrophosphatase (RdgB/HAM1 family)